MQSTEFRVNCLHVGPNLGSNSKTFLGVIYTDNYDFDCRSILPPTEENCQIVCVANSLLHKVSLPNTFCTFLLTKSNYTKNMLIFYTCKCTFVCRGGGWVLHCCVSALPMKEGGTQEFAGTAPYSQTVGSLLGTLWSPKSPSANSLKWNKFWPVKWPNEFAKHLLSILFYHKNWLHQKYAYFFYLQMYFCV